MKKDPSIHARRRRLTHPPTYTTQDGFLDYHEFVNFVRSLNLNMNAKEVFQFFLLADVDNDYRIIWSVLPPTHPPTSPPTHPPKPNPKGPRSKKTCPASSPRSTKASLLPSKTGAS